MNLFQAGNFTLRSGKVSSYKLECDALTPDDWMGVAALIMEEKMLPPFCVAHGVPRGGIPFAIALDRYATRNGEHPLLIAEDVVTTGGSMERFRKVLVDDLQTLIPGDAIIGVCLFARGPVPDWVTPVFQMFRRA